MFDLLRKKNSQGCKGTKGANDEVRRQLCAIGDDGKAVRHVVHYAHPLGAGGSADRKVIDKYLRESGFRVKDSDGGIIFENHQSVDGGDFDQLTDMLRSFLDKLDWEYGGWECAIASPESIAKDVA